MTDRYLTPYRYEKPIIEGSGMPGTFDSRAVDVPFAFRHQGQYYMMYTGYDGIGYQTALATSSDLLRWRHEALILPREAGNAWDATNICGTWILKESDNLYDVPTLKKWQGRYWMVYHAYPEQGFEEGPAEIGLAWCEDESLLHWTRHASPVLSWRGGGEWECGGLYKACVVARDDTFFMYYNAKTTGEPWLEQTGFATSTDLFHWEKHAANPVLPVGEGRWDSRFASDPYVVRDGQQWLMFYYGYDGIHAQDGLATSTDMQVWQKCPSPILAHGAPGSLDAIHAHKPAMFYEDGRLYHFYCAVREHRPEDKTELWQEYRTIAVACSRPFA